MRRVPFADHESLSRAAAEQVIRTLQAKPNALICAASGSTPHRTYELLAEAARQRPPLFREMRLLQLDEWGGIPRNDPGSCEFHLRETLAEPLQLADRFLAIHSDEPPEEECERVDTWLREYGPIDLCILGLGLNGHLGFNEPADELQPHAHEANLSETSLQHAMLGKTSHRPTHGLTLGMADILQSKGILILVSGEQKRAALRRLLTPTMSTRFPASLLWLHRDVQVFSDRASEA
jgi:galactosamine-6-phosphate isomerase